MAIVSGAAFAKTWTNHIGVGVGVPVESVKPKDGEGDSIFQAGFMFDATYIGVHENGFTVKAGFDTGALASDDVELEVIDKNETQTGAFVAFNFGAGYSFVRTEKVLFGTTAMFTYAYNQYEKKDVDYGEEGKFTNKMEFGTLGIGADVFGSLALTNHFGLYANLGIRYIFGGTAATEIAGEKVDADLKGNVLVLPSLGVMWRF